MDTLPEKLPLHTDLGTRVESCQKHGGFESKGMKLPMMKREIWSACPTCAAEREAAEREALLRGRAQLERERLDNMMRASGIPERVKGCTFANFHAQTDAQKSAMQTAMEFAETFDERCKTGDSLIFAGRPGTGKGHLAAAIMNRLIPERLPIYTTCLDMIRAVRETWRRDSKHTETEVLTELQDAALLIIDEIGVQYGTDGEQTVIFDVLDRRYRQMRSTIFITNQDKAGFKAYIGERAYDRLTQTAKWVPFDWNSYRTTARRESA